MINAVYSHDSCLRAVTASPSTMLSCLSNFPPLLAEVTLVMNPDSLTWVCLCQISANHVDQLP
eukprot:scaffold115029_cov31-Tisochrysis_lutea.AAC.3